MPGENEHRLPQESVAHMRSLVMSLRVLVQQIENRLGEVKEDDIDWLESDLENLQGIQKEMEDLWYD